MRCHLGPLLAARQPLLDVLAPLGLMPSGWGHQQLRGAAKATKKKAAPAAKGKKGQAAPAKKSKQRMETKPFDDKDPLLQKVIAMLVPPAAEPPARSRAEQQELVARVKEFSRARMQQHAAWQRDLGTKLALKRAAIQALPPKLRAAALREDRSPFPLTRHFLYDVPPDGYRD